MPSDNDHKISEDKPPARAAVDAGPHMAILLPHLDPPPPRPLLSSQIISETRIINSEGWCGGGSGKCLLSPRSAPPTPSTQNNVSKERLI